MCDHTGWIVRSTAGHDRGELFCVVGQEGDTYYKEHRDEILDKIGNLEE